MRNEGRILNIAAKFTARDDLGNLIITMVDNKEIVIHDFSVMPNDYHSLREMMETRTVEMKLYNVRAIGVQEPFRLKLKITYLSDQDTFLIVDGGWIPLSFISRKALLLADRNVISTMQYRYSLGILKRDVPPNDFDAIFLHPAGIEIDISLFSIESNQRKIPERKTMDEQIKIAKDILRYSLPELKRAIYPNADDYFFDLFDMLKPGLSNRTNFFMDVAAGLNRGFTSSKRKEYVPFIFSKAKENGLKNTDIAVLLAFLRITMLGKKTAATQVIKESQTFRAEDGYNVACDLMALEVLMNYISHHKKIKSAYIPCFITKDKGLAQIAALMMNIKSHTSDGEEASVIVTLPLDIFSDEREVQEMIKQHLQ
ncbi:hypothetical protein [Citrobacter farmeri]|uniref:hypothetical protein n=1 Tax=Citrobacter farmeri TaxID=67824 RepID=UPI0018989E1E|nr:hypothetical protein [Citrobacter farmeri]MDB2168360.1 hypothetical protein [Citrobacter farmeri]